MAPHDHGSSHGHQHGACCNHSSPSHPTDHHGHDHLIHTAGNAAAERIMSVEMSQNSSGSFPRQCSHGAGGLLMLDDGHIHGPDCGHDVVQHDDHYDYVGDDGMLHHLLTSECCSHSHHAPEAEKCEPMIVSHGRWISSLHRRKTASPSKQHRCTGPGCTLPCCASLAVASLDSVSDAEPTVTKIYCSEVCCPMEIPVADAALHSLAGVIDVEVSVVTKTIMVRHVPALASPAAMVAALNEARLGASLTAPRSRGSGKRSWVPPAYVLLAGVLLIISLVHYLAGATGVYWLDYFEYVALGSVALCLPGIALKALGALRHWVMDIHLLITLASIGAIAIGDYIEAGIVVVLFKVSDFLEERCTGQARDAIAAVLALKPDNAVLEATGEEVPAASVPVGVTIIIRAGDKAPLDGVVVSGSSAFDESILTGESLAAVKNAGDEVRAGTLNAGSGLVKVRTTTTSEETFVAGMARLVEEATSRQSPAEAAVAKFARIYTPLVLLACILLAFVPWSNPNADRTHWVYLSLQVLVTACPCALVLSTPVTIVSALARAAQVGVLVKGGVVLESLCNVEAVTLDKTGTLTRGAFMVETVAVSEDSEKSGMDERQLLRLLGSLERGSSHPLAAAIVGRAAARGAACDAAVHSTAVVPGFGIEGVVEGQAVRAGTAEFLRQLWDGSTGSIKGKESSAALEGDTESTEGRGLTTCYVAVDERYAGYVAARDVMRPEAPEAVAALRALGITPAMLTGDNRAVAAAVAEAAGISPDHTHASLLPQDKLELVAAYDLGPDAGGRRRSLWSRLTGVLRWRKGTLLRRVRVAHVGDGVNDAPALAAADVGIAMGVGGAAAALEAGSVALFTNDLRVVPALVRLARAASRKIAFNIALSVVTKIAVLVLAALGKFTLFGAVLVDVGTALLVTLNGLTLLRYDFKLPAGAAACVGEAAAATKGCSDASCKSTSCGGKSCCDVGSTSNCTKSCNSTISCKSSKSCCDGRATAVTPCCAASDAGAGLECCGVEKKSAGCGGGKEEGHHHSGQSHSHDHSHHEDEHHHGHDHGSSKAENGHHCCGGHRHHH